MNPGMSGAPLRGEEVEESPSLRILIIAGEPSGDVHGARLVERILARSPTTEIYGIGGDAMERAGVRLIVHASRLTVVGAVEVLDRLPGILDAFRQIRGVLKRDPPDGVVLIDFPDFNLRVARRAARRRIPVVYYISPQVWAWRRGRLRQIARNVKRMLVVFPFERDLYERHGIPVTYVGHPLLDHPAVLKPPPDRKEVLRELGLSPLYPVLGLFPGSRTAEVRSLLPDLLAAARDLRTRFPHLQVVLGEARDLDPDVYDRILAGCTVPVRRVRTGIASVIRLCDLALVASGTATLEVALFGVPMIVVYRVSWITYHLGKWLIRVPAIGLANLVPQKGVVPELIQQEVSPERLVEHALRFFTRAVYLSAVRKELARTRTLLGSPGASDRAARIILEQVRACRANGPQKASAEARPVA